MIPFNMPPYVGKENDYIKKAIENNHQLYEPSHAPRTRDSFFSKIQKGKNFNQHVLRCFPKDCLKQNIKRLLIKTGLRGGVFNISDYNK